MTTYEMPPEPNVDVLWTHHQETGEPIRWTRTRSGWTNDDGWVGWPALLVLGPVHDVHPYLVGLPPFPWTWSRDFGGIEAADSGSVPLDDRPVGEFIVRAVNAYVVLLNKTVPCGTP